MRTHDSKLQGIGERLLVITFIIFCFLIISRDISAQSVGEIAGRVYDAETNDYLPGANIMLEGTYLGAASDRDGLFRITNVPAGTYLLKTSYMGYEDFSAEVTVAEDGKRVIQDIPLTSSYLKGDEVVVVGERQGQAKALSVQKSASNIMNVVAQEQMQRFPDLNTAEVAQRVPAVSVERDQGEGRYVLIRGTEPRLNTTTINGEKVASPEDEDRFVGLDVISSNQLASIEVVKALTPDMDGDAIGGAVNLVTKSAFDYDKQVLNFTVGGGYGDLRGRPSYQLDLTYANRFGANKNIGFTISGSYHGFNRGSDNNEMEWGDAEDPDGNEIPFTLQNMDLRDYWTVNRDRFGFSSALEYRMNSENQFFVNGIYNFRRDSEWRNVLSIIPEDGEYMSATEITGGAIERSLRDRTEDQMIYSVTGGGQHLLNKLGIDYKFTYTYGSERKPGQLTHDYELNEAADMTLDLSDTDLPKYTITNFESGYVNDPINYILDGIELSDEKSTDKNIIASLNLQYPFRLGKNPGNLKLGGKMLMKDKKDENETWDYSWEGESDLPMTRFPADEYNEDFMDGNYDIGFLPDGDKLRDFFNDNRDREGQLEGEYNNEDADPANYKAKEDVYAYYLMANLNVGKATFLAGLRHEFTKLDYTGNEVIFNEDGDYETTKELKGDDSYSHILPSVHVRYSITPQANLRASFTRSLSRPNYYNLVPYEIILREDEEIARGNPTLKATTASNFDLMAEYYMQGIGILSGGAFYKALNDIIYITQLEEKSGPYEGYEVEQPVNGGKATLLGFEVNWQQQFTFLPGFLGGFGIYANYTYTDSKTKAKRLETKDSPDSTEFTLPGQAGDVANFALTYEKYGFQARLGFAYFGEYIFEVGEFKNEDVYYDKNLRIDFSASQRITSYLQAYLQFVNLSNTPLRYYIGDTDKPIQREFYSWWMQLGLKFNL